MRRRCSPALTFVTVSSAHHLILESLIICSAQKLVRQAILIWNSFLIEFRRLFFTWRNVAVIVTLISICCVTPRAIRIIVWISAIVIVVGHSTRWNCVLHRIVWSMGHFSRIDTVSKLASEVWLSINDPVSCQGWHVYPPKVFDCWPR